MKSLTHANKEHETWFVVNWCLGNTCNFSCSYCPEVLHDGSNKWPDLSVIQGFVDRVFEQKPGHKIAFEFTGGEVTVYRYFTELCDYIKSKGGAVGFISNASRTLRWWQDFRGRADHACLSFHAEEGDPEHFFKVVETLHDNMNVHVNVMMHPDRWDACWALAERIKSVPGITMAIQPLIVDFGDQLYEYTAEQHEKFNNQWQLLTRHIPAKPQGAPGLTWRGAMIVNEEDAAGKVTQAHQLIAQNRNNWAGWHCAAGVEQIIVDMDQTIWRGWCRQGGRLGYVSDPGFRIPDEWVHCRKVFCHCNFDIMTTKIKHD